VVVGTNRKIAFPLFKDADDYPPFDVEDVWATSTDSPLHFVIDNIPFFATQATLGDVVSVKDEAGRLVFEAVVSRSSSSLVRVIVFDMTQFDAIRGRLNELGCSTEAFTSRSIMAVDIPASVRLPLVQSYLRELTTAHIAECEEAILRHQ
jgi:hypothetical protein